jgi:RimJ/RimL family protein N-acetyltransferase
VSGLKSQITDHRSQILLEPVDLEHAAALQRLASDPAIGATSNLPSPYPRDGAVRFVRQALRRWRAGRDYVFAVISDAGPVGVCSLLAVGEAPRAAELGYWIGRPFWGEGYATEAARRVVRFGFRELALDRVRSSCLVRNPASRRVLEKVGFKATGVGGNANPKWSAGERFMLYELTRAHWGEPVGARES